MLFVPRSLICSTAARFAPSPIESIDTTAVTPKITPSVVSSERSLWLRRLSRPIRQASEGASMGSPRSERARRREQDLVVQPEVLHHRHPVVAVGDVHRLLLHPAVLAHVHERLLVLVVEHGLERHRERLRILAAEDL